MPLTLKTRWSDDIPVVVCKGRIVEGIEADGLRAHLDKELAQQSFVLLDLSGVDFIDSSGLGLLVRYAMRVKANPSAKTVAMLNPNDATGQDTEVVAQKSWAKLGIKVLASDWVHSW